MKIRNIFGALLVSLVAEGVLAAPFFYEPTSYLKASDSPFAAESFNYFYLENFIDGLFNEPGASINSGNSLNSVWYVDSVDGDDGDIDGNGNDGGSWFPASNSITVSFSEIELGQLPTHAGIVWTDVNGPDQNVIFSAYDGNGNYLGDITRSVANDSLISGGTAEDRFFGIYNADGISSITLTMPGSSNWEIDHIQYGVAAVPVPAALWLFGSVLTGLVCIRRKLS